MIRKGFTQLDVLKEQYCYMSSCCKESSGNCLPCSPATLAHMYI